MHHKSWTKKKRVEILAHAKESLAAGDSLRSIARKHSNKAKQLREWMRSEDKLKLGASTAKSICTSRFSMLNEVCEELLRFKQKSAHARDMCMRRFLKLHRISIRAKAYESEKASNAIKANALDFFGLVTPLIAKQNRHQNLIINMDQALIFFTMNLSTTLNPIGNRTVHVHSSTSASVGVTAAITVAASCKVSRPCSFLKVDQEGEFCENLPPFQKVGITDAKNVLGWMKI